MSGKLYDKHGVSIERGDVLKVYHFTARLRRKRHYMYKQARGIIMLGKDKPSPYMRFGHLDLTDDGYWESADGRWLWDYEIVQSLDAEFQDRTRRATTGEVAS